MKPGGVVTSPSFQVQPVRVAGAVERVEHAARERRGLFEHRIEDVERLLAAGERRDLVDAGELAQDELHVAQAGLDRRSWGLSFLFLSYRSGGRTR